MAPLKMRLRRDDSNASSGSLTPTTINLLIALLTLFCLGILASIGIILLRRYRRSRPDRSELDEAPKRTSKHRRLTITAAPYGRFSKSIHVYNEKQHLVEHSSSPPSSPDQVPEIRITFPDEEGEGGRRSSGRVVLVRVGDTGIGLEPLDENLPPYQSSDAARFQSLDLDRTSDVKHA